MNKRLYTMIVVGLLLPILSSSEVNGAQAMMRTFARRVVTQTRQKIQRFEYKHPVASDVFCHVIAPSFCTILAPAIIAGWVAKKMIDRHYDRRLKLMRDYPCSISDNDYEQ